MGTDNFTKLLSFLESVEEPRSDNKCHKLIDILMIAICATLADADGWSDEEKDVTRSTNRTLGIFRTPLSISALPYTYFFLHTL